MSANKNIMSAILAVSFNSCDNTKSEVRRKATAVLHVDKKEFEKKSYGGSSVDKKKVITVKVRMTKEEAARMLSKCKDGGFLDFKDVAQERDHREGDDAGEDRGD